jgi:hypothetical protein
VTRRKPRQISTGRLPSLRLFSTLLAVTLTDPAVSQFLKECNGLMKAFDVNKLLRSVEAHRHAPILQTEPVHTSEVLACEPRLAPRAARASCKITEVHDLFLFVAFLKVTLEWLTSVHTAPHGFSLVSQRTHLWTNVPPLVMRQQRRDRENWIC